MRAISQGMISLFLLLSSLAYAEGERSYEVDIRINIKCPFSEEFKQLMDSIPQEYNDEVPYVEFKKSLASMLTELIHLVESEKVYRSSWYVQTSDE